MTDFCWCLEYLDEETRKKVVEQVDAAKRKELAEYLLREGRDTLKRAKAIVADCGGCTWERAYRSPFFRMNKVASNVVNLLTLTLPAPRLLYLRHPQSHPPPT